MLNHHDNPDDASLIAECQSEPIHIPRSVQPFGVLLALDENNRICQCSENVGRLFGRSPAELLHGSLEDLIPGSVAQAALKVYTASEAGQIQQVGLVEAKVDDSSWYAFAHHYDGVRILEFLPQVDTASPSIDLTPIAMRLSTADDIEQFAQFVCEQFRAATGYDRVMVYRFAPDWHGQVIAESLAEGQEPYLGLHYPDTDIPPQARSLYQNLRVRVLVSATDAPVPLTPILNPTTNRDLDLSFALSRSLSPIHREYLTNMGVQATLVTSILHEGRLWGLIACHHRTPRLPCPQWITASDAIANLLDTAVTMNEFRDRERGIRFAQTLLQSLPGLLTGETILGEGLISERGGLMEIMSADGLAILHQSKLYTRGITPSEEQIRTITDWLASRQEKLFSTHQLGAMDERFSAISCAAGLLAIHIPDSLEGWVLWFRQEVSSQVVWAGDPRKSLSTQRTSEGRLSPRKSFASWVEQVRGCSRYWTPAELATAAEVIRPNLLEVVTNAIQKQLYRLRKYQSILFEQIHDAVIVTDLDGNITFWNDGAVRTFGWTEQEMLGRSIFDRLRPEDRDGAKQIFESVLAGEPFSGRYRDTHKDGRPIWIDIRLRRIYDESGQHIGIMGASRDITSELEYEQRLRLKQAIVRQARDSIIVTEAEPVDQPGPRIVYVNPAVSEISGYTQQELIGATPRIFQGPLTDPDALARIRQALKTWQPIREELINYRKDGSHYWIELDISPLSDEKGFYTHWIGIQRDISERKRAEVALRESERRFKTLADAAPAMLWVRDEKHEGIFVSRGWCEFTGLDRLEGLELGCSSAIHPDDRLQVMQQYLQAASERRHFQLDYRLRRADGEYRWVFDSARPHFRDNGQFEGYIGSVIDVHERKLAEAALRENEGRLQVALSAGRMGTWEWEVGSNHLIWDHRQQALFGFHPGEFDGQLTTFLSRIHPEDLASVQQALRSAIEGQDCITEFRIVLPNSQIRWLRGEGSVLRDSQGRPTRLVGINYDLTDRKNSELQLRQANLQYQLLADYSADVVGMYSAEGTYLYLSPSYFRLTGRRPEVMIGQPILSEIHPDDLALVKRAVADNLRGETTHLEYRLLKVDLSSVWVEAVATPILNPQGPVEAVVVSTRDITQRRQLEDQIRQAQKLEAIGQLAGGVAHDFNNLLTVVNGFSELMLADTSPNDPHHSLLQDILRAGERGAGLTRQLLAFSRQQMVRVELFNPSLVAQDCLRMLTRLLGEDLKIQSDLDPSVGMIRADAGQFEQVLINLAVNARDAMPNGGTLTVSTSAVEIDEEFQSLVPESRPGEYVAVTVSDTGVGMSAEVRAKLFEPFFTTKPPGKGTGLGLATVYGIVRQAGGFLMVESELGRGSQFYVYFPRHDTILDTPSPSTMPDERIIPQAAQSYTLLLVEDDPAVRTYTTSVLERSGYHVIAAESGPEALSAVDLLVEPPDLVVTDVVMPGMSGRELAEILTLNYPRLKLLFLSGYTQDTIIRYGVSQDRVSFLQKPFTSDQLLNTIHELLAKPILN